MSQLTAVLHALLSWEGWLIGGIFPRSADLPLSALNLALLGQCVFDLEEGWLKSRSESLMEGTHTGSPTDPPGSGLGNLWPDRSRMTQNTRCSWNIPRLGNNMEGLECQQWDWKELFKLRNEITCLLHKTRKLEMPPLENSLTRHGWRWRPTTTQLAKDRVSVLFPLSDNPLCGAFIERES